jgi:hypothetical protein
MEDSPECKGRRLRRNDACSGRLSIQSPIGMRFAAMGRHNGDRIGQIGDAALRFQYTMIGAGGDA